MDKMNRMKFLGRTAMTCLSFAMLSLMVACSSTNDDPIIDNGGEDNDKGGNPEVTYVGSEAHSKGILFNENELGTGDQNFVFEGNVTLSRGTYLLKGWIYIADGARLTIPEGTIIKGDKQTKAALIVEPGGYLSMKGTRTAPIVMTSAAAPGQRKPGDWGGLIICGKARNNQLEQQIEGGPRTKHGGTNDADNSGIFQYIRVEFAGYPFDTDKEINGITFGSVGSGTTIDHLQVSYSNDDSFEWFGGSANATHLVAYRGWDDDFDTDNGFSGTVQYALSIRDPRIADTSQSNSFESDNNATGADVEPFTTATFRNVTVVGPITAKNSDFVNDNTYINGGSVFPANGSNLGKFQSAVQIRRSSKLNIANMLAIGFPIGLIVDGDKGSSVQYARDHAFSLTHCILADMTALGSDNNKYYGDHLYDPVTKTYDETQFSFSHTFFLDEAFGNRAATAAEFALADPASTGQDYCPAATISDGSSGYIGAFRDTADNWLEGWTNFDPQNTIY
jgi:hypothetical protein